MTESHVKLNDMTYEVLVCLRISALVCFTVCNCSKQLKALFLPWRGRNVLTYSTHGNNGNNEPNRPESNFLRFAANANFDVCLAFRGRRKSASQRWGSQKSSRIYDVQFKPQRFKVLRCPNKRGKVLCFDADIEFREDFRFKTAVRRKQIGTEISASIHIISLSPHLVSKQKIFALFSLSPPFILLHNAWELLVRCLLSVHKQNSTTPKRLWGGTSAEFNFLAHGSSFKYFDAVTDDRRGKRSSARNLWRPRARSSEFLIHQRVDYIEKLPSLFIPISASIGFSHTHSRRHYTRWLFMKRITEEKRLLRHRWSLCETSRRFLRVL